jgi:hypothetical protein
VAGGGAAAGRSLSLARTLHRELHDACGALHCLRQTILLPCLLWPPPSFSLAGRWCGSCRAGASKETPPLRTQTRCRAPGRCNPLISPPSQSEAIRYLLHGALGDAHGREFATVREMWHKNKELGQRHIEEFLAGSLSSSAVKEQLATIKGLRRLRPHCARSCQGVRQRAREAS